MPSSDTVRSGKYQLIRPFVLVTKSDADPEVPAFIDFATSADGQAIVAKNYVGVR
jgi:ABC-type phosphate transport system substrate-binding protein